MRQMQVQGIIIEEYSDRSTQIQGDIEDYLAMVAIAHGFNWTAPIHDIVRRLMNEVREFNLEGDEE